MNPLEKEINAVIKEVETGLLKGHINTTIPHIALEYSTKLGAYLSMCYGLIEKLDTLQAQHHVDRKIEDEKKSDLAISKLWKVSDEGIRQAFWENRIKRIKVLMDTLTVLYYQGRDESKLKELK